MIYYELLQEYKRHCSAGELETLIEMDQATAPLFPIELMNWQGDVIATIRSTRA